MKLAKLTTIDLLTKKVMSITPSAAITPITPREAHNFLLKNNEVNEVNEVREVNGVKTI